MPAEHVAIMMFENYDAALEARSDIMARHADDVTEVNVELRDDEAGPVESNFVVGNKRHDGKQKGDYEEQFKAPRIDGAVPLIAWCGSDDAVDRVKHRMRTLGGRDVT
jgi:hypothetical protein